MPAIRASLIQSEPGIDGVEALPPALHEIAERIEASRAMVRAGTNQDDEETGYDEATWRRAARLVGESATAYWRQRGTVPPVPVISDGPDGVVDILWKHPGRQLLLTVHTDPEDVATFYGRDLKTEGDIVQGELALDRDNE